MCFNGCKFEDLEGECRRGNRFVDETCLCFNGFKCGMCSELCEEDEESETEGICNDCFNEEIEC